MWRWTPIQVELCGVYTLSQVNIRYGLKKGKIISFSVIQLMDKR